MIFTWFLAKSNDIPTIFPWIFPAFFRYQAAIIWKTGLLEAVHRAHVQTGLPFLGRDTRDTRDTPGSPQVVMAKLESWSSRHFKSLQVLFFSFLRWVKICGENHEQYLFWWLIINFRQTDVIWCVCSIFRHTHIINILWSCTGNHPITGWFTGKIPSATHHDEWMIGLWNGNPQRNIEQPPSFSQNSIPGWNPSIRE